MGKLVAAAVLLAALVRPAGAELCPLEEAMHAYELMEQGQLSGRAVVVP